MLLQVWHHQCSCVCACVCALLPPPAPLQHLPLYPSPLPPLCGQRSFLLQRHLQEAAAAQTHIQRLLMQDEKTNPECLRRKKNWNVKIGAKTGNNPLHQTEQQEKKKKKAVNKRLGPDEDSASTGASFTSLLMDTLTSVSSCCSSSPVAGSGLIISWVTVESSTSCLASWAREQSLKHTHTPLVYFRFKHLKLKIFFPECPAESQAALFLPQVSSHAHNQVLASPSTVPPPLPLPMPNVWKVRAGRLYTDGSEHHGNQIYSQELQLLFKTFIRTFWDDHPSGLLTACDASGCGDKFLRAK